MKEQKTNPYVDESILITEIDPVKQINYHIMRSVLVFVFIYAIYRIYTQI